MADREAKVKIGGDTSGLNRALGKAKGDLSKWAKGVKSEVGGALRGAFEGLGNVAGFAGLGSIALAARETKLWNDRLVALQQTTGYTRTEILAMNQQIQRTAIETGASQDNLLKGIERYQELTGEADKFTAALGDMAKIANATNANMEDLAGVAAAANQQLGVLPKEMMRMFDVLAVQGDRGAVELKNMASLLPQVAAMAARFKTKGVSGVAEWGAALQVVRRGTGDAAQASTQLIDLAGELITRSKHLEKAGVQVYSDKAKTQAKDFLVIVDEIQKKIPRYKLNEVLGSRKEALFAYDTIVKFRKEITDLATTDDKTGAIVRKNNDFMASSTAQFAQAMNSLHKTANDLMMGALPGLARNFERVAAAIKWIGEHKDVAIAAFAAWKLAPRALAGLGGGGSGGGAGGAAGALAGLGGPGGAVPVYVTNLGPGGLGGGPGGAVGAAGAAASKTASGLAKLDRAVDVASKVLFSFGIGYAAGGVLADLTGVSDMHGHSTDVASLRKYGDLSEEQEKRRVYESLYGPIAAGEDPNAAFSGATGQATYAAVTGAKGSARRFGHSGAGADESEAAYVARTRAGIDARSTVEKVNAPINELVAELRRTREALANQKMFAVLDHVNEKITLAVQKSKTHRRKP